VGALAVISKDGKARTAADPPSLAMDTDVPTNIASLSKVLTTIGVLQSLAKHNLTIDSKISPFLPPDWTQGANIGTITFHDLLTHSAGFRDNGNGSNTTYAVLKQQIADGVKLADKSTPLYDNLNFAIFRELLPYMEGFNDPGPATRPAATAAFYINYMRQHVFQPLGVGNADCKPAAGSHPVLYYPPPPIGAAPGIEAGDWTLACGGGGWVLTAGDLYKVMLDLAGGHTLLTDAQKTQMNTKCLGWDCSVQTQNGFVGKNGLLQFGNASVETFFGVFKGSVPVVLIVNSVPPANITTVVVNAFNNATVPHP
jgi:CubicO group peptidase (beta-lactamase class C family)